MRVFGILKVDAGHNRSAERFALYVLLPGFKRAQYDRALQAAGAEESLHEACGFRVHGRYGKERHDDGQSFHFMMRGSMPAFLHRDLREG